MRTTFRRRIRPSRCAPCLAWAPPLPPSQRPAETRRRTNIRARCCTHLTPLSSRFAPCLRNKWSCSCSVWYVSARLARARLAPPESLHPNRLRRSACSAVCFAHARSRADTHCSAVPSPSHARASLAAVRQGVRAKDDCVGDDGQRGAHVDLVDDVVPKPLKFLRPHYDTLKANYETATADAARTLLADVLSLLAMTMGEEGKRESLNYKLLGSREDLGSWGHEYVRHLSGEIGAEYNERLAAAEAVEAAKVAAAAAEAAGGDAAIVDVSEAEALKPADELLPIIMQQITPFFFKHNAEAEAIDLLMEVGRLEELIEHVDKTNCDRICGYLGSLAMYVPEPEDSMVLTVAVNALRKLERYPEALMMAVRLGDDALLEEILTACDDPYVTPHHPAPLLPPLPAPPPARRTHNPSPTPHRLRAARPPTPLPSTPIHAFGDDAAPPARRMTIAYRRPTGRPRRPNVALPFTT